MLNAKLIRLTDKQFDGFKQELQTIINLYKQKFSEQKTINWKTYEKQWTNRLRTARSEMKKLIDQAAQTIRQTTQFDRPPITSAQQKALILLQKDLTQFSNRKMADLLPMFKSVNEVETSCKTIERA
jgi:hypothetical protein